ncbi:MAG: hypothetical protein Roseis2KO_13590 [Roseivirga sp.]
MEKITAKYGLFLAVFTTLMVAGACSEEVVFDFDEVLADDLRQIDEFLDRNNINTRVHTSEARYRIVDQGVGDPGVIGDTISYLYKVYLLDSSLLETNRIEYADRAAELNRYYADTIRIQLQDYRLVTPAFHALATLLVPEKGTVQVFLPSYLGYTFYGRLNSVVPVPPNIPLMIELESLELSRQ